MNQAPFSEGHRENEGILPLIIGSWIAGLNPGILYRVNGKSHRVTSISTNKWRLVRG